MIWDGECHFCRRWIERWREITAGEVEYAPYQEIADRFPEIPREQFQRSVPNLFLDASLVSTGTRSCLFDCVRFTLDPDRRSRWIKWHFAYQRLFVAGTPRVWIQGNLDFADTLLV